ncbi:hypothetical protein Gotur_025915, partial [Gossypium turneri]
SIKNVIFPTPVWSTYTMLEPITQIRDEHKHMVVAEDAVWNSYISSHKAAGQFRNCSFPYYDQFTSIYAKD